MDKRDLALTFRERLRVLIAQHSGGVVSFARATGIDRSALNQLLSEARPRLPRAETLRRLAEAKGVTTDWLLGLSNAPESEKELAPSVEIETAFRDDGSTPLDRWWQQSKGAKVRYVPATLPDMLRLPALMDYDIAPDRAAGRAMTGEIALAEMRLGLADLEIAMPLQTLEDVGRGGSIWADLHTATRRAQLEHMADLAERHYPALRLHLYDGRQLYSAPFTVFGHIRAAIYLGDEYLVLTAAEQVRAMIRTFDTLVRRASVSPDRSHLAIREIARGLDPG